MSGHSIKISIILSQIIKLSLCDKTVKTKLVQRQIVKNAQYWSGMTYDPDLNMNSKESNKTKASSELPVKNDSSLISTTNLWKAILDILHYWAFIIWKDTVLQADNAAPCHEHNLSDVLWALEGCPSEHIAMGKKQ